MSAFCIGLTGGAGSGKSRVAARLAALGAAVIDTDILARELVAPGMPALAEIVAAFGAVFGPVLQPDGHLDRARLRAIVFADATARQRLEAILHPRIRALAAERLQHCQGPYAVLVVPLLVEHWAAYQGLIDRVLVIDCPEALQQARLMARDGMTEPAAAAMLAAQATRPERLALADDVLDNSADIATHADDINRQIDALHATWLRYARRNISKDVAMN